MAPPNLLLPQLLCTSVRPPPTHSTLNSPRALATDHRVYTELGKLTPAEDEGRDATNKVITAVRGIVRLATMDFSKWGHAQNKMAVRLILEKLGPKTRKALGPTGRFAVKNLAELAVMNPIMLERAIVNAGNDYPKVIIAPDQATENDAKKALEAQGCDLFNNNGPHAFVPCPDMRNMIVFLDERGDFNPVSDISNIDTWKANADSENPSKIRAYRTGAKDE